MIPITFHYAATPSKTKPVVVLTHHFGGSASSSQRHVNLLTKMGYDCVSFDFSWHGKGKRLGFPFGLRDRWAKEIGDVLDQIGPDRKKIIYSFSGPSASALQTIVKRAKEPNKNDVVAFICDSGPFMDPKYCTRLMIEQVYGVNKPLRREIKLAMMMAFWGPHHDEKLKHTIYWLAEHRARFPVLSFRGIQDTIVPIEKIRDVFDSPMESRRLKNLTVAEINCGHLTGLKEKPQLYSEILTQFLEKVPQ